MTVRKHGEILTMEEIGKLLGHSESQIARAITQGLRANYSYNKELIDIERYCKNKKTKNKINCLR